MDFEGLSDLRLNPEECEISVDLAGNGKESIICSLRDLLPRCRVTTRSNLGLLGSLISPEATAPSHEAKLSKVRATVERLSMVCSHAALFLLSCGFLESISASPSHSRPSCRFGWVVWESVQ